MSTKTKNYQFVKPEENEFYDINIPNANWDIADAELKRRVPEDGDISGTQVSTLGTITEEFPIPAAGDTTKTIVGKIKKFFEDFKNLKSSLLLVNQVVNNCTTDRGDLPGAAAQLKVLMDLYTKLNSDLVTLNSYEITPTNIGIKLYYRKLGPCKSIYAAGTHTVEWTAGTTYGLATVGGIYTPSYSWSKRIPYKTSGNVHFATLSMDTSGQLTITPETVGSGGTLRIHEMYF